MKKIITLSAIFMCMAPYAANAGSLDVHGEIKVNGNTVIDAKGNYVGTLPSNGPSMISLNDYYNQDGLKKTFKQVQLASENQTADEGVRIDDYTTPGVIKYTYQWNANAESEFCKSWVSEENHDSSNHYTVKGYCVGSTGTETQHSYTDVTEKKSFDMPTSIQANGGSYLNNHVMTQKQYYGCQDFANPSEDTCQSSSGDATVTEVVFPLNKTTYTVGDTTYDDCYIIQFNGNTGSGYWTGIHCKNVGLVSGWNSTYSIQLTKVEGTLQNSATASSSSLKMAPAIKPQTSK